METEFRFFADAAGRLPALILAALATFLVLAAINVGFAPHAADPASGVLVLQSAAI